MLPILNSAAISDINENGSFVILDYSPNRRWLYLRHPTKRPPNRNTKLISADVNITGVQ